MVKTLPLKGYKCLRALNAFHALMLGLKMLPSYMETPYEKFYASFEDMSEAQKEKLVREAVLFVRLEKDEVEALISFAVDKNDVAYGPINLKNLGPDELHEIIVAVCMDIGRIKIDIITEEEKKKLKSSQSTSEVSS